MAETRSDYDTILGPDAKFKGDLSFDTTAKVQGSIEGSIKSKGKILIANGSKCKASVTASGVAVEGHVQGNVQASERIEIKAKGRITGDIVAARMTMADGASIDGHIRIGLDAKDDSDKSAVSTEPKMTKIPARPQTARAR